MTDADLLNKILPVSHTSRVFIIGVDSNRNGINK